MRLKAQNLPRRAFTLVELLAVIAIIAALASLLAPALSQAKFRAKNAICRNNLRQVGLALHLYAATYEAYVPARIFFPERYTVDWDQSLEPFLFPNRPIVPYYYNYGWETPRVPNALFLCPFYSGKAANMPFEILGTTGMHSPLYAYNNLGLTGNTIVDLGRFFGLGYGLYSVDSDGNNDWSLPPCRVLESDVVAPSEMTAFGDPFCRSERPEFDGFYRALDCAPLPNQKPSWFLWPAAAQACRNAVKVHGAQFNRFYCDGHVEMENFKKRFVPTDDYLSRFNSDHKPHRESWNL